MTERFKYDPQLSPNLSREELLDLHYWIIQALMNEYNFTYETAKDFLTFGEDYKAHFTHRWTVMFETQYQGSNYTIDTAITANTKSEARHKGQEKFGQVVSDIKQWKFKCAYEWPGG